jgi:hypothetical protein
MTSRIEQKEALDHTLTSHKLSEKNIKDVEKLRQIAKQFGHLVIDLCPDGRNKSLAITNLEQSLMWAVKAIACDGENNEV